MKSLWTKLIATLALSVGLVGTTPAARAGWWCEAGCDATWYAQALACGVTTDMLTASFAMVFVTGGGGKAVINCLHDAQDFMDSCINGFAEDCGRCKDDCRNG